METRILKKKKHKILPVVTFGFFCLVAFLLYQSLSEISYQEVSAALKKVTVKGLIPSFGLVMLNYLILSSFDLIGLRYLGVKKVSNLQTLLSSFICYTFTLNLGALVGGLGLRYRIYTGWKIDVGTITKVILFSTLSNWLGHIFLVSAVLAFFPEKMEVLTSLPRAGIFSISALGATMVVLYFVLCFRRSEVTFKQEKFRFPPVPLACLQLLLAITQWCLLSTIVVALFTEQGNAAGFMEVLFTYLMTGIAGVLTHIPAGLGVHEAIFLKMNFEISPSDILAALITYRLIYYLIPLALAVPSYLLLEIYQKKK